MEGHALVRAERVRQGWEGAPPTPLPQPHRRLSPKLNSTRIMSSHLLLLALALCATGGRAAVGGTLAVNQAAAALTSGGVYSGGLDDGGGAVIPVVVRAAAQLAQRCPSHSLTLSPPLPQSPPRATSP